LAIVILERLGIRFYDIKDPAATAAVERLVKSGQVEPFTQTKH
jgi:hypothetical protein